MLKFILKFLKILSREEFNIADYHGGWKKDKEDSHDFSWGKYFGGITPLEEELPEKFSWRDKMPKELPFQGAIPSCVMCSFIFTQAFNQKKEWNKSFRLSWRFLWANSPHNPTGASYREVAKVLRQMGTSSYDLCPDQPEKGFSWVSDKANVSNKAATEALQHRIDNYTFPDVFELKRAIYRSPLPIAVGGNKDCWNKMAVKNNNNVVKYDGNIKWYHSIVATGFDGDKIEFANWFGKDWGDNGYGWLEEGYPLSGIISLDDLVLNVLKVAKTEDDPAVYWIANGWKHAIVSAEIYREIFHDPDWQLVKTISNEEMESYQLGEKIISKDFIKKKINEI